MTWSEGRILVWLTEALVLSAILRRHRPNYRGYHG
jgi:hypothetical protein